MYSQYKLTAISTQTTTTIQASGNITIHTVVVPKTTAGTVTFQDSAASAYFVLPASTVAGTYIIDTVCPKGLAVVTASADNVLVSTQTP